MGSVVELRYLIGYNSMSDRIRKEQPTPPRGGGLQDLIKELHGLQEYENMRKFIDRIQDGLNHVQTQLEGFDKK